jgi:hypothetical protein
MPVMKHLQGTSYPAILFLHFLKIRRDSFGSEHIKDLTGIILLQEKLKISTIPPAPEVLAIILSIVSMAMQMVKSG